MAKHSRTLGERLIRIILKHRGNATLRQIAWGGLRGEGLVEAKRQTKNLVVFEPTYRNGKQQASETARLTDRGVWEAIRMSEVYDPTLLAAALAAPGIEAYLTRLEKERHPIAVKIAGYRKDAELWQNRQERDADLERNERQTMARIEKLLNKLVDKIPSKICTRDIRTLNAFLEKKGRPRIEPEYIKPGDAAAPATPASHPTSPARSAPARTFADDLWAIQGSQLVGFGESSRGFDNNPKPQVRASTGETRAEVVARAKGSGHFFDGAFHTVDNQIVNWQEWAAWAPK